MIRALILWLALASAVQADSVRIGTEPGFAPYVFVNAQGEITGLDRELADTICRRANLDCQWQAMAFDALLPALVRGDLDVAIGGIAATRARQKTVAFSQPYVADPSGEGVLVGYPNSKADLSVAKIATQAGTIHHQRLIETGRDVASYATNAAALEALRQGVVDLFFGAEGFVERALLTTHRDFVILGSEPVSDGNTAIAFRKDDDNLRAKFDAALAGMRVDGSLMRLIDKWFPTQDQT